MDSFCNDTESSTLKQLPNRWRCLAAGCILIVCAGAVYGFGAFSDQVKSNLEISQHELGLIALSGNVGLCLGNVIGGAIADFRGPRYALLCGSVFLFVGYGGMYLALSSTWMALRGPTVAAALWLATGTGSGFVYNATIFTNTQNFSASLRGAVVGMLSTLFGASSTIWITVLNGCLGGNPVEGNDSKFTCGAGGWMGGDVPTFMLFLAIVLPLMILLGIVGTVRVSDSVRQQIAQREDDSLARYRVKVSSAGVIALLAVVGATAVMAASLDGSKAAVYVRALSPALILVLLLLVVLLTAAMSYVKPAASPEARALDPSPDIVQTAQACTPGSALHMSEFWLLFVLYFVIAGTNITTINILSTIFSDRGVGSTVVASIAELLVMFVSSLSRFAGGWIISVEPTQAIALRLLAVASVCAIFGQLLFAVDSSTALFCAVVVIGCSDGLFWCALPVASIRVFGAKHSGGIFGMIISFGTIGIVTFSYAVQPAVYDAHTATGDTECHDGIACFSTYHLLCAAGSTLGLAAAVAGLAKTRRTARSPS